VREFRSVQNAAAVSEMLISSARAAVVLFRKHGSRFLRSPICLLLRNKPHHLPWISLPLLKPMSLLLWNQPCLLPLGHLCPASPYWYDIRVRALPLLDHSCSPVGLAALGSLLFSGLGQVYNGQLRKGVVIFFGTIAGVLLFVVPGITIWIFGVADAWLTAKKMNEGTIPFQEHSWLQIIAFFIYSFVVGYLVYSFLQLIVGTMIDEGVFLI